MKNNIELTFQIREVEHSYPLSSNQVDSDNAHILEMTCSATLAPNMRYLLPLMPTLEIWRHHVNLRHFLGQGQFGTVYTGSFTGLFGEPPDKIVKVAVEKLRIHKLMDGLTS